MALATAVLAAGWAGIEAYFAAGYRPPFDTASYAMSVTPGFTPPLNADGFRQPEPTPDIFDPHTIRTLFLGDSFTFGHGVPDGSDRFTALIDARLNAERRSDLRYHVYNAGVNGTEPTRWLGYLKGLVPSYRPHTVFAVFFLRDGTALCTSLVCHKEELAKLQAQYTGGLLYRYSFAYRVLADRRMAEAFNRYYENLINSSYLGSIEQQARWRQEQQSMKLIAELCKQNGIEFRLVIFPILLHLQNYPFHRVEAVIKEFAKQNGIPVFSLTPGFLNKREGDIWVGPGDQHPNPLGHRIAADTLYPVVRATLDAIDPRGSPGGIANVRP